LEFEPLFGGIEEGWLDPDWLHTEILANSLPGRYASWRTS
jgi:hypothetical protein